MSWSGFKKSVARTGTTIMQKTGQVEKTVDREFLEEENRFKVLEKNGTELQKQAKAYLEAMRAMTASQVRIADTIDRFYGDNSEAAMAATSYKRAVDDMDSRTTRELDAPFRSTVLDPIGRLVSYFPEVKTAIAKREKKLIDYDAARSKTRKLMDKPSDDATKLPRAEQEEAPTREVFEAINSQLVTELPQLLDLRIPYLEPSFEAMVRMQCRFTEEAYEKLGGVQRYFPDNVRDEYANGQLDAQVEGALAEIKELSIAA